MAQALLALQVKTSNGRGDKSDRQPLRQACCIRKRPEARFSREYLLALFMRLWERSRYLWSRNANKGRFKKDHILRVCTFGIFEVIRKIKNKF
jgi:hypothetical protein